MDVVTWFGCTPLSAQAPDSCGSLQTPPHYAYKRQCAVRQSGESLFPFGVISCGHHMGSGLDHSHKRVWNETTHPESSIHHAHKKKTGKNSHSLQKLFLQNYFITDKVHAKQQQPVIALITSLHQNTNIISKQTISPKRKNTYTYVQPPQTEHGYPGQYINRNNGNNNTNYSTTTTTLTYNINFFCNRN